MAECGVCNCYRQPRVVDNGTVVSSNRTVYRLSEDDVLLMAQGKGVVLTEDQLTQACKIVEFGMSESGWDEVVGIAVEEATRT